MTRPTQHPAPNSTPRKAETERRANLTVVPCCDAAAAVARVRELLDEWERFGGDNPGAIGIVTSLRAALDGPAGGGGCA